MPYLSIFDQKCLILVFCAKIRKHIGIFDISVPEFALLQSVVEK